MIVNNVKRCVDTFAPGLVFIQNCWTFVYFVYFPFAHLLIKQEKLLFGRSFFCDWGLLVAFLIDIAVLHKALFNYLYFPVVKAAGNLGRIGIPANESPQMGFSKRFPITSS